MICSQHVYASLQSFQTFNPKPTSYTQTLTLQKACASSQAVAYLLISVRRWHPDIHDALQEVYTAAYFIGYYSSSTLATSFSIVRLSAA